jgi:hypothetical protein
MAKHRVLTSPSAACPPVVRVRVIAAIGMIACLLSGSRTADAAPTTAPHATVESGVPFLAGAGGKEKSFLQQNGQRVVLPCGSTVADRACFLGMTNTPDRGSPTWMVPAGDRSARFFIGTQVGEIEIEYIDGSSRRLPLVFGFNVWWHKTFEAGYVAPFDSGDGKQTLDRALRLQRTGAKPPAAFVCAVKLDAKPVRQITLVDNKEMEGTPVVSAVTLHRASGGWAGLSPDGGPVDLAQDDGSLPDWDRDRAIDPGTSARDIGASVDALRAILYTSAAELDRLGSVPLTIPKDYPPDAPHVQFKGDLAADLLTNEFYANAADTLVKTAGGRYRTSTPGATNFGRYTGIGTWRDGVGWNENRAWSRDFGAALIEVAHLGFQHRAEQLADYAFQWQRWYPEHHITYPDGTPTPAHWTRCIDVPEERLHNMTPQGCAENDGHGLLMLGTYQVYLRTSDRVAWAKQRWPDLEAAAEWICWQFEHPATSHATRVLYTESECARPGHASVYADFICSEALRAYAEIADAVGRPEQSKRWRDRAAAMEAAELDVYPKADPVYGRIWDNPVTWSGRYPMLGPLITLADRRGLLASAGPEWDRINLDSYQFELHEHAPDLPAWHMAATGYGQCFVAESALLLDHMNDAADLVEVLAKASYFPGHFPYIVPEGVEWTADHRYWFRKSDLGNGVQQANFLKVIRLLVGIDDAVPETPQILPRLPQTWTELSLSDYPLLTPSGTARLAMTYKRPDAGTIDCAIHADHPIAHLSIRLGPFGRATEADHLTVTLNGVRTPFTLDRRGDAAWVWVKDLPAAAAFHLTGTVVADAKPPAEESNADLFQTAVLGKVDGRETAKALWRLFNRGEEVKAPRGIWLQGPAAGREKVEIEDLMALQGCRLSKLNEVQYVFYGSREAKQYLYLLQVRMYPDGKPRFVILACAMITPEAENDPGIRFDHPSVWDMPEPGPAQ